MKTAISVPDKIFEAAEAATKELGLSRSEFYRGAAEKLAREVREASLTEQINASLARVGDDDSEFAIAAGRRSLNDGEKW